MASFKKDIDVSSPGGRITCASIQYNTKSKLIFFRSPANVINSANKTYKYQKVLIILKPNPLLWSEKLKSGNKLGNRPMQFGGSKRDY